MNKRGLPNRVHSLLTGGTNYLSRMKLLTIAIVGVMLIIPSVSFAATDRPLSFNDPVITGEHVRLLQTILNDDPRTRVSTRGIGAPGNETTHLGTLTRAALIRFQELHKDVVLAPLGLSQGTGMLGKNTRALLENMRLQRISVTVVSPTITNLAPHEHHPGEGDGAHAKWYNTPAVVSVPRDMWVTAITPEMRGADQEILHHAMVFRVGEPNPVCPNIESGARELFAVSANSVAEPVLFPTPHALHLKKDDLLYMEVMAHNPLPPLGPGKLVADATFAIRLSGVADNASSTEGYTPLEFVRIKLDDSPCRLPLTYVAFKVPAQTPEFIKRDEFFGTAGTTTPSGTHVMPHDANIIGVGANIWPMKGGRAMRMLVDGEKRIEIPARAGGTGDAWSWSLPYAYDSTIIVKKDDVISAEAVYTNPNSYAIPDASGMIGFYFARATSSPAQ